MTFLGHYGEKALFPSQGMVNSGDAGAVPPKDCGGILSFILKQQNFETSQTLVSCGQELCHSAHPHQSYLAYPS